MTPQQMMDTLSDEGDNAGADYNDGLHGWFSWTITTVCNSVSQEVKRHELAITFTDRDENATTHTWQLWPQPRPEHNNPTA